MSDTPRTDAFEALLNRPTNWWDFARQLERENADLHDTIDAVIEADERAVTLWRATHPGNELVIPDRAKLLEWLLEQNAALRADKERLMQALHEAEQNMARCLDEGKLPAWSLDCLRAAIDAARKEQE